MEPKVKKPNTMNLVPACIVVAGLIVSGAILYQVPTPAAPRIDSAVAQKSAANTEVITPAHGVVLPVVWGDLGAKLVETGVIDEAAFRALYEERGQFSAEYENLLLGTNNRSLKITKNNAGYLLNLFWALGLASQNRILEEGQMMDPRYGGAANFASTGGWTMSQGSAMSHYGRHHFFDLSPEDQFKVERVAKGVYRSCCSNSTHFPDCNHGMAMLGLLQLLASQGVGEEEMYQVALVANSYWFPETYTTIERYLRNKGVAWNEVRPSDILGSKFSSASGYARIVSEVQKGSQRGGSGSCSV